MAAEYRVGRADVQLERLGARRSVETSYFSSNAGADVAHYATEEVRRMLHEAGGITTELCFRVERFYLRRRLWEKLLRRPARSWPVLVIEGSGLRPGKVDIR